ncbi:MAG: hypothetical protein ED556_06560 [Winogradskyella sp.]|uniref:TolB family protein n=1 Tax=Winogradskyella sp. TaxID=1883156 RepID=UPI000F3AAFBA|nr:hypothetical protein [Winogradskyella sp.]RNC87081.1 MAG: hypothetical protein ED556_06560 [Winogradskyella sp.]
MIRNITLVFIALAVLSCSEQKEPLAKIGYVSYASGSADIYLMDMDGSNVEQITNSSENNSFPFQIDAKTIGFTKMDKDRNQTAYQVNIYTKEEKPYQEQLIVEDGKWQEKSNNGRYVAFVKSNDYRDRELYVYDSEMSTEKQITSHKDSITMAYSINHSWSSDDKKLLFMSGPDWYNQYIRYYDMDKDTIITVTDRGYMNSGLLWANDDMLVANLKIRDKTLYELYSVELETGKVKQLTDSINLHPNISPNKKTIVFESQRNDDGDIYTMNPDGSNLKRVTTTKGYEGRAFWFQTEE